MLTSRRCRGKNKYASFFVFDSPNWYNFASSFIARYVSPLSSPPLLLPSAADRRVDRHFDRRSRRGHDSTAVPAKARSRHRGAPTSRCVSTRAAFFDFVSLSQLFTPGTSVNHHYHNLANWAGKIYFRLDVDVHVNAASAAELLARAVVEVRSRLDAKV